MSMKLFTTQIGTHLDRFAKKLDRGHMLELLVYIKEANVIAEELSKDIHFEATPAIDHTILKSDEDAIEEDLMNIDLWIKVENLREPGHPQMWPKNEIIARLATMRAWHDNYIKRNDEFPDPDGVLNDPFFVVPSDSLLGRATLFLGGINYLLRLDEKLPILDTQGRVNGEIIVQVVPCLPVESKNAGAPLQYEPYHHENMDLEEEQLQDYMGERMQLRLTIRALRGLPADCNSNTFVEYRFYCDEEVSRTDRSPVKSVHPVFETTFHHNALIHEDFIRFIVNDHIELLVYGSTGTHIPRGMETPDVVNEVSTAVQLLPASNLLI